MKQLLIVSLFLGLAISAIAQKFERKANESAGSFVKRITNLDELPHPVIETKEWDSVRKSIIYFVPDVKGEEINIIGYLLIPINSMNYSRVLIDTFQQEGANPKIETVFFANADKDKQREMIIQTSWEQNHRGAGVYGMLYGTYIYDNPNLASPPRQLKFFKSLSAKLDGGFEGKQEGKKVKAKYKTVNSIKAGLKKMGY